MKSLIITVDTEGDNLWAWKEGNEITTENSLYIPRFQDLCEEYEFKPVYLTNLEMCLDKRFVQYIRPKHERKFCEVGMHLHAWNTPPEYSLKKISTGNPYITEYPNSIIKEKASYLKRKLENTFGFRIVSHRSGRWAVNTSYLTILKELGITIDCSVTPQLDLTRIPGYSCRYGPNYSNYPAYTTEIIPGIVEVPMTTRKVHHIGYGSFKHKLRNIIIGDELWFRPITQSVEDMITLVSIVENENTCDHLEFMVHSSELMPGGSPYFKNAEDVEHMYKNMEILFQYLKTRDYRGMTLTEYVRGWGK